MTQLLFFFCMTSGDNLRLIAAAWPLVFKGSHWSRIHLKSEFPVAAISSMPWWTTQNHQVLGSLFNSLYPWGKNRHFQDDKATHFLTCWKQTERGEPERGLLGFVINTNSKGSCRWDIIGFPVNKARWSVGWRVLNPASEHVFYRFDLFHSSGLRL